MFDTPRRELIRFAAAELRRDDCPNAVTAINIVVDEKGEVCRTHDVNGKLSGVETRKMVFQWVPKFAGCEEPADGLENSNALLAETRDQLVGGLGWIFSPDLLQEPFG